MIRRFVARAAAVTALLPALAACGGERDAGPAATPPAAAPGRQVGSAPSPAAIPLPEAKARISVLQKRLIPPAGTPKEAIDRVYGEPRYEETFKIRGSPRDYPLHSYVLIPATDPKGEYVRAFLNITYRDGRVDRSSIKHLCVVNGPAIGVSAQEAAESDESETRGVLADLEEIDARFGAALASAPWVR
jgi:hypothetical protein